MSRRKAEDHPEDALLGETHAEYEAAWGLLRLAEPNKQRAKAFLNALGFAQALFMAKRDRAAGRAPPVARRRLRRPQRLALLGVAAFLDHLVESATPTGFDLLPPPYDMSLAGLLLLRGGVPKTKGEYADLAERWCLCSGEQISAQAMRDRIRRLRGRFARLWPEFGRVVDGTGAWLKMR